MPNAPKLLRGDCRDHMLRLADEGVQFDAIITDPPYDLTSIVKRFGGANAAPAKSDGATGVFARASRGFMGQQWDGTGVAFDPFTWTLAYDVLKPGGHIIAFGGSRTFHRMTCAIEDAGLEIRDCLMWLYGTGFPKSHNVADNIAKTQPDRAPAWNGWGTALKPACEPIVLARRPLIGTVAANVLAHGVGGINIDACRIETGGETPSGSGNGSRNSIMGQVASSAGNGGNVTPDAGRWPANVLHDGSDEVLAAFAAYGESKSSGHVRHNTPDGVNKPHTYGRSQDNWTTRGPADTGTAARFFYSAKATAADRAGSKHPTVKPLSLMRWLCTLVVPPGGRILDPFSGSGTTLQAAFECGFDATGCEMTPEYQEDIERRIAAAQAELDMMCS